jgi:hypothetical protein
MIARLLNLCGLYLGPADMLLGPDAANPLGHFEHKRFLAIDRKLLKHFRATWYEPPELKPGWERCPELQSLADEARMVVATFPPRSAWGWKEPRSAIFLPFWKEVIPNMRFVICIRNPLEVARSLEKRNRIRLEKGASLWYRYTRDSLADTEGSERILTFFDDFFGSDSAEIHRVIEFCGLQKQVDKSVIGKAIAGELRHYTSETSELLKENRMSLECKLFYTGLRDLLFHKELDRKQPDRVSAALAEFMKLFKEDSDSSAALASLSTPNPRVPPTSKLRKLFNALKG